MLMIFARILPLPEVVNALFLPLIMLKRTSGYDSAILDTKSMILRDSDASDARNLYLAGTLKNRSRTVTVVPSGHPTAVFSSTSEASTTTLRPDFESAVLVMSSVLDTAQMLARASPRKPRVPMQSRSLTSLILLVAWRRNAVSTSDSSMPKPLSVTRI